MKKEHRVKQRRVDKGVKAKKLINEKGKRTVEEKKWRGKDKSN